ncbi:MAG: protein kinase [Aestuariibacter sp.]|nr:protein kinase [Aestuariibacter sp.]
MSKLNSILFNRTINQFLECEDLDSKKALSLAAKIRASAKDQLDKILVSITQADEPHKEVLKNICRASVEGFSEDFLLNNLSHDETIFRQSAADMLSQSQPVNAVKLFNRLHEKEASCAEIIELLKAQVSGLKPEDIINNALKLDGRDALELLALAEDSEQPVDLSALRFQPDKIGDTTFKAALVRYFGNVHQLAVVELIAKFLSDPSKLVILEVLKSLNKLNFRFDVAIVLPFLADMNSVEQKLAIELIEKQADAALLIKLPPFLSTKSPLINDALLNIIAGHATEESLEKLLYQLEAEDSWSRGHIVTSLQALSHEKLKRVARTLGANENEFVRSSAQKISGYQLDADDLEKIGEFALNENWQVRQRAIQTLGKSAQRGAIIVLKEVLKQWPDTAISVLDAVKLLGFSKGLEIAFKCIVNDEPSVQRVALETIALVTSEKHALKSRDGVVLGLPRLNLELTELAKQTIRELTLKFNLPALSGEKVEQDATEIVEVHTNSKLPDFKAGSTWMDRYHIKKVIGQGAMGRVVLAEDDVMEELLILKFMHPELTIDQESRERFKREVKYARRVGHPNVIRVHDLLFQGNVCAISMEYFKSRGLEKVLKQDQGFNTQPGLQILYQISDGMTAAHEQAVIHRDLKPSNVLIDEFSHVKIADFGIASASSGAESTLTQTGSIIGSPAYLAPERIAEMEADNRSDIYSLGVIAYFMFSGQLPYVGQPMAVLMQHREGKAPMVHEVNSSANIEVSRFIKKMMEVDPANRPQTMLEVRDELKTLLKSV